MWSYDNRRWRIVDRWLAGSCGALFVYSVLSWRGLVGDEAPYRPIQTVLLTGALLLQALAALARWRSRWLLYLLLTGSVVALGLAFAAR
jgi:hypothetical protein